LLCGGWFLHRGFCFGGCHFGLLVLFLPFRDRADWLTPDADTQPAAVANQPLISGNLRGEVTVDGVGHNRRIPEQRDIRNCRAVDDPFFNRRARDARMSPRNFQDFPFV
jgi:hypothetical protein